MFGADDHHYFLDIDMTPLGGEPEDYALYSTKIQQEYGPMPANQYRTFRLRVSSSNDCGISITKKNDMVF